MSSNDHDYKVSKGAEIRNRCNQVPHLTQDTNGKVTNSQLDTTNESQEVSPFPAGDHKVYINRRANTRQNKNIKDQQKHMFNVSTLYRKSIKLIHHQLWEKLIGQCKDYNSIGIKPYTKSHLEQQRAITWPLALTLFVVSFCLAYMNMFARFVYFMVI